MQTRLNAQRLAALVGVAVAGALIFAKLGERYLWQDEAQTALIGQTILHHGVPMGTDGVQSYSQELGAEYGANGLWRWHTWLPFYLEAGSLAVFGPTSFGARFPFALCGLATVVAVFFLARRLWDARVAWAAAALLAFCVPFIILARQCRYYSVAALLAVLTLRASRSKRPWALVAAATALFHVHYIYCATFLFALLAYAALFERATLKPLMVACAVTTALALPWIVWLAGIRYGERYGDVLNWEKFELRGRLFTKELFTWTFPQAFWWAVLGAAVLAWALRRERSVPVWLDRPLALMGLIVAANLGALTATSPAPFYRYLAPLVPVVCLVLGRLAAAAFDWKWFTAPALAAVLLWASPLRDYWEELRTPYHGPVEGMVQLLQKEARPGQTVVTTYEDLPLKFYTGLRVFSAFTGEDFAPAATADWIFIRQHLTSDKDMRMYVYLRSHVDWSQYQQRVLDVPDTWFDNREDLREHPFRTVQGAPRMVVFQRR